MLNKAVCHYTYTLNALNRFFLILKICIVYIYFNLYYHDYCLFYN